MFFEFGQVLGNTDPLVAAAALVANTAALVANTAELVANIAAQVATIDIIIPFVLAGSAPI